MQTYYRERPRGRRPLFRLTIIAVIGAILGIGALLVSRSTNASVISPLPNDTPSTFSFPNLFVKKKNPEDLRKKLVTMVGTTWKNYSIYVKDYNSDFSVGINEAVIYTAASVNKIPILAALYYGVQNQEIDLDKTIAMQASDIQDYGTGIMRYEAPGTTYSIKTLAKLMIQQSDNTAAYILANYVVGISTLQERANMWGLTQTDIVNNKTSNKDMELLLSKIYRGKVANVAFTQEMLAFLQDSDFEDRLPALLPKDANVYHKIGTEVGVIHDVGIIKHDGLTYYIGIFTSDVNDEPTTTKLMAEISKTVYDYLRPFVRQ